MAKAPDFCFALLPPHTHLGAVMSVWNRFFARDPRPFALVACALLASLVAGELHAQSRLAPSIDTVRYRSLRVKPSETDATIKAWDTTHVVYYDPTIPSNRILLWLAGTNGTPLNVPAELFNTALAQGYRVIALSYLTVPAVSQVCVGNALNSNANCAEEFRRKRIYGDNTFTSIDDQPQDAIISRLSKLLQWLNTHDASGKWSSYLAANGTTPKWSAIAVSGQSQGGGMAEFIAQRESVARVVSFSGGWDYANSREKKIAGWYSKTSVTPMERWYATYNVNEIAAAQIREISNALRIPSGQIFALDKPLMNPNAAAGAANPYHGDGIRNVAYKSVWQRMLGSGIE